MQISSYGAMGLQTAVATARYVRSTVLRTSEWLLPRRSVNAVPLRVLGNWHFRRYVTSGHGGRKLNWQSASVFCHGQSPNSGRSFNFERLIEKGRLLSQHFRNLDIRKGNA